MPFFLSERRAGITEKMDSPECDTGALYKTYRRFSIVNSVVSGWRRIYNAHIKPELAETGGSFSLLDIGFGGGDIPIKLAQWAAGDGFNISVTAIDTDKRAVRYARQLSAPESVKFLQCSSADLLHSGESYDMVVSNHLLHHLGTDQLQELLQEAKQLSTRKVVFNDIERSDVAYGLFSIFSRPLSVGSFITEDGLASVKRSFTRQELHQKVPGGWQVEPMFPFRLLLTYRHE